MTTQIPEDTTTDVPMRETGALQGGAEGETPWVNATGDQSWDKDPRLSPYLDRAAREIANWVTQTRGSTPSIFNRAAYVSPENPYAQMATAKSAVENDDIIGGVADVTEGLAFQGIKWESEEADEADVFNQLSRDLNLDEFIRQYYREEFTYSQAVVGIWWGTKTYTVRGRSPAPGTDPNLLLTDDSGTPGSGVAPGTDVATVPTKANLGKKKGVKRKRKFTIVCPVGLTLLDPMKVVPLRPGMFGQDRLAWHATDDEYAVAMAGEAAMTADPVMSQFTAGPVSNLGQLEEDYLSAHGINIDRLLYLNPNNVWRATRTKAHYDRFAVNRLKSVFSLLDMKQQLLEADRVMLVGAANYIIQVKQGSKEEPAKQPEIDNLKENFKILAKLPVIIGDHRLSIEIITPKQDQVLETSKYDVLDRRIMNKTLGAISMGGTSGSGQRSDTSLTIARGIARTLENRRHMMKRELEREIARGITEHPMNAGLFADEPSLTFTPRNVQLDADQAVVNAILSLRTSNELSRESTLEYFGFDQAVEALRRDFEAIYYDDTFKTQVPFSAPAQGGPDSLNGGDQVAPQVSGGQGGRPLGGGDSPQSVQGQTGKGRTPSGNPSTGGQ